VARVLDEDELIEHRTLVGDELGLRSDLDQAFPARLPRRITS